MTTQLMSAQAGIMPFEPCPASMAIIIAQGSALCAAGASGPMVAVNAASSINSPTTVRTRRFITRELTHPGRVCNTGRSAPKPHVSLRCLAKETTELTQLFRCCGLSEGAARSPERWPGYRPTVAASDRRPSRRAEQTSVDGKGIVLGARLYCRVSAKLIASNCSSAPSRAGAPSAVKPITCAAPTESFATNS